MIAKTIFKVILILCSIGLLWSPVNAEDWSPEQKEVWSVIENRWENIKQGDYKAFEASVHDDAIVWWGRNALPLQKDLIMGNYQRWITRTAFRPETYQLELFAIQIIGDIANVFYSYNWKSKSGTSNRARVLASLTKQNGKWLWISSMSSSCNKLPACID